MKSNKEWQKKNVCVWLEQNADVEACVTCNHV